MAIPSGQEVNGPGDQPGDPDQEGGKREVSSSAAHGPQEREHLTSVSQSNPAALLVVPVLPKGWNNVFESKDLEFPS